MKPASESPLRLTIDARKAFDTGIGTYVRELLPRVLDRLDAQPPRVVIRRGDRERHDYLESDQVEWVEVDAAPFGLREQWTLRSLLQRDGLFWATSLAHPLYSGQPMVNTVHDLAQLALPATLGGHGVVKRVITQHFFDSIRRCSTRLLFISDFTAREFERLVGHPSAPVDVIGLGVDAVWFEADAPAARAPVDGPYFVMLGNLRPHKNLAIVLDAFARIADRLPHRLVLIGPEDDSMQTQLARLSAPVAQRIVCTGPMRSDRARAALRGSDALLFASRYEGFGLPVLEAMACGCLPIVARNGISPALVGPEALAFDPDDAAALARAMLIAATMPWAERQRRVVTGQARARRHSWDRAADATAQALRAAASSARDCCSGSAHRMSGSTSPMLRPLHVGKYVPPPYAGIESHVDTLLRAMADRVEATLVASEPATPSPVRREATPYRLLGCRSYGSVASVAISPSLRGVVRREFAAGRANLLHVHAPNPWGDLAALDSSRDTPVVMTWHSDVVGKPALMALYGRVQQRALQRADRIVVFTPRHLDSSPQLRNGGYGAKIVQIPIGVDFARLDRTIAHTHVLDDLGRWANGRPMLLSVGRQVPYKGYPHLINAMATIRSDAVLLMIGTGLLGPALARQARELGIEERVRFLGEVDQPTLVAALQRCDIFALPSIERSEAFGIASAEAMAFGKPTIVCELGNGVNFLNRAGETSLVTQPRDEAALADAIDQLASDASLRERLGTNARSWVRAQFSVDAMRDATLDLYRQLT